MLNKHEMIYRDEHTIDKRAVCNYTPIAMKSLSTKTN